MISRESLRKELEALYGKYVAALRNKDLDAFFATTAVNPEQLDAEMIATFPDVAASFLETALDLSQTTFVAVMTEGGDLAGYYSIFEQTPFINVLLTPFRKTEGTWKIVPGSWSSSFEPQEGIDSVAKALKLIETSSSLDLASAALQAKEPAPALGGESLQAILNCSAYDYEVQVAINGVPIKFSGGKSFSEFLSGSILDTPPAEPAVLHPGENQITVEYKKIEPQSFSRLTVDILVPPDRCLFQLKTSERSNGKVTATFTVPAAETNEPPHVSINDDEA